MIRCCQSCIVRHCQSCKGQALLITQLPNSTKLNHDPEACIASNTRLLNLTCPLTALSVFDQQSKTPVCAGNQKPTCNLACSNPANILNLSCPKPTCQPACQPACLPVFHNIYQASPALHPTCVPKSSFMTSSYCSTVLSPAFGVQCAATQFKLQPVGKAMPAAVHTMGTALSRGMTLHSLHATQ